MKKTFLLGIAAALSLLLGTSALAARIAITGSPMVVTKNQDGVWVSGTALQPTGDYYYLTMDNAKRVCYKEVNPALANLTPTPYNVKVGENVVSLQCYDYSPDYFE